MHLPQPHACLYLEDRSLIDKVKKAVEYEDNGCPMKDVIDDVDVIEAMRLLVRITTEDELHSIFERKV